MSVASEMTEIILRLLWRFYPIAWLTTAIVRGLSAVASWLEEEETYLELASSQETCAYAGGWLALAEERLNELVTWKAMKLLKRRFIPPQPCGHHLARAVKTPREVLRRLTRLIILYHDHRRLYELRARKLARLFAQAELQLETVHHPVASTIPTIFSRGSTIPIPTIFPSCLSTTIFASSGTCPAQRIRAPPWLGIIFRKPAPSQPARPHSCRAIAQRRRARERDLMSNPCCLLPARSA
jgi:hypothetical protein